MASSVSWGLIWSRHFTRSISEIPAACARVALRKGTSKVLSPSPAHLPCFTFLPLACDNCICRGGGSIVTWCELLALFLLKLVSTASVKIQPAGPVAEIVSFQVNQESDNALKGERGSSGVKLNVAGLEIWAECCNPQLVLWMLSVFSGPRQGDWCRFKQK